MANQSWQYLASYLAAIVISGTALGCSGGGGTTAPTPTPTASVTPGTVSFSTQVQPIFTANCSTSGCHTGASVGISGGMDLTAGTAFSSIKDRQTQNYGALLRVKSGDTANSVLLAKLQPDGQRTVAGRDVTGDGRMPLNLPPLSAAAINTIRTWIAEGAQNN